MRIKSFASLIIVMGVPCLPLAAQVFSASPGVAAEQSVAIGSGHAVRVINRVVFDPGAGASPPGRSFGIQYVSCIDPHDTAALHREADTAAQHFGREATALKVKWLSITVLDDALHVDSRRPAIVSYSYQQNEQGVWKASGR